MRNNKLIPYLMELAMRGLVAGSLLSVMLGYVYGDGVVTLISGLGISLCAAFVFALVRSRTTKFGLFFLWHILFSGVVILLMPTISGKVLCGLVLAGLIIDSVTQLKKNFVDGNKVHFSVAAVFLAASYGASYMNMALIEYSCFVITAVFMALYFMRIGFYNTQEFIENNDNGKGNPLKDIKLRSYSLVGGFGLAVGIFMVAVRYMGGELIIKHIGNAFLAVFSALARWIIYKLQGSYVENPETTEDSDMFGFVKDAFEERQVPAFLELLEKIIRYFFIAAIIIGAIVLVIWLIYKLYSIFGEKSSVRKNTTAEFIRPVKSDKVSRQRTEKKNVTPVQNKARRYYKRYITKNLASKELSQTKTPFEISSLLGLDKNAGDAEIRRIYEKARYSDEDCTKDEIKALKEYIKGRGK